MKIQVCLYGTIETSKEIESRSVLEMDMRLRWSYKDYKDSCEKSRIQVFYKEILNQYHPVSSSFIQVAQKKVKIDFENADSSSRVELIPSKIKHDPEWSFSKKSPSCGYCQQDERRMIEMFGHVKRRPQSALVRRVKSITNDDVRRKGRLKLRWEDGLKTDLNELLLSEDMTSDRNS
nr:hypothetical protein [Tanacetum cinerariifolium]